jgi:6-pyruvoyltetrahydropterin/6-carboxytetrahydropterin synthase
LRKENGFLLPRNVLSYRHYHLSLDSGSLFDRHRVREARMSWKVLIERGNLGFSAAHFITFEGQCEPLHGHNYGVRVEVEGELTPDSYVLDFVVLKNIVRALCKEWDHRFLLPLNNPHLRLTEHEDAWEVVYNGPLTHGAAARDGVTRYLLPKAAVVPLPIDNATAERLAQQLARRIADRLREADKLEQLDRIQVGVEETEMQAAFFTLDLRTHPPGDLSPPV